MVKGKESKESKEPKGPVLSEISIRESGVGSWESGAGGQLSFGGSIVIIVVGVVVVVVVVYLPR